MYLKLTHNALKLGLGTGFGKPVLTSIYSFSNTIKLAFKIPTP